MPEKKEVSKSQTDEEDIRESRIAYEFQRMLAIRKKEGLIDFRCADLSAQEANEYLAARMHADVVRRALPGFLTPEEFQQRFPNRSPEKYLVGFRCMGLLKSPDGEIVKTDEHGLEIVFGVDYPVNPPRFVWLTPIWHPNILPPYLCTQGRPFAIGTPLDMICLMVGQMIQYRSYNVLDALNHEAAEWAAKNRSQLPVDTRGLLDGKEHSCPLVVLMGNSLVEWTEKEAKQDGSSASPLVELT